MSDPVTSTHLPRQMNSEEVIANICGKVVEDELTLRGRPRKPSYQPRERRGRSRTPLAQYSPPPHAPPHAPHHAPPHAPLSLTYDVPLSLTYEGLGARPKVPDLCKTEPCLSDNRSIIFEASVDSDLIDLTDTQCLPSVFPIYSEPDKTLSSKFNLRSERQTPTPTPNHSPAQSVVVLSEQTPTTSREVLKDKLECLEITTEKVLGRFPPKCNSDSSSDTDLSLPSSPSTFPTSFRGKTRRKKFVCINEPNDSDYIDLVESADSDGRKPGGKKLERIVTQLRKDGPLDHFLPKVPLGLLIPSLPPPEIKKTPPAVRPKTEAAPCKSFSKALGPNSRALGRERAVNKAAVRLGKNKKRWIRRQRSRGERNRIKPLNWWLDRYLSRSNFHRTGDPNYRLSIRLPTVDLPHHHCIDSVVLAEIFDHHLCLCDREEEDLTLNDPSQCWCMSSVRELTVKFIIESSAHQNENIMDITPDI